MPRYIGKVEVIICHTYEVEAEADTPQLAADKLEQEARQLAHQNILEDGSWDYNTEASAK